MDEFSLLIIQCMFFVQIPEGFPELEKYLWRVWMCATS